MDCDKIVGMVAKLKLSQGVVSGLLIMELHWVEFRRHCLLDVLVNC